MEQSYYVEEVINLKNCPLQLNVHLQESYGPYSMVHAHIHGCIEIIYPLSGLFQIMLNHISYDFTVGEMILINSNEVHSIRALSNGLNRYIVIKFDPSLLYSNSQSIFDMKYVMPFVLKESYHQRLFKEEEISTSSVPSTIHSIYKEFTVQEHGYELAIKGDILHLFLFILRHQSTHTQDIITNPALTEDIMFRLQSVFDYVEKNYQNPITSKDMAKLCNLSYSYFSRTFKKIIKRSFNDYLNYIRITKAEVLLTSTSYNITEIAMMVGFSTSSYFIQQFKHYTGISPKQFQLKYENT